MAEILFIASGSGPETDLIASIGTGNRVLSLAEEEVEALSETLQTREFDVVLLGVPRKEGTELGVLDRVRHLSPHLPILAVSHREEADLIVRMIRGGAVDFLPLPVTAERLEVAIARALCYRQLENEIQYLRRGQDIVYDLGSIVAESPPMKRVIEGLRRFADTDATILVTGETGTGKSFLSGAVHFNSARRQRPFVKINCANIPETLLESELFGHEKGAFTGANRLRTGRLEQGHGGTVFMDEIGEMSLTLQAKILRFLEEKRFERVGGNRTIASDIRIIAATNRNPEKLVASGLLREDLYYRINVLRLHLPALRERRACIEPLSHVLLQRTCRAQKKRIAGFSRPVLDAFLREPWPGNIRQLANTIERAAILEDTDVIQEGSVLFPERESAPPVPTGPEPPDDPGTLVSHEREVILRTLKEASWVQKDAARTLGITPRALNYKIKKLGITHPGWRRHR